LQLPRLDVTSSGLAITSVYHSLHETCILWFKNSLVCTMPHCMLVSRKAPDKLTALTTPLCEFRTFKTSTCMYGNLLNIPRNMGGV